MLRDLLLDLFDDLVPSAPAPTVEPTRSAAVPGRRAWLARAKMRLAERFGALGLRETDEIRVHANTRTMVSWSRRVLRLHAAYADAPDAVLLAIVRFLDRRTPRPERLAARRALLAFPVLDHVPPEFRAVPGATRRTRTLAADPPRPGDDRRLVLLRERHRLLNARHFGGTLGEIPLRLSGRMRRKLGHLALEGGMATEICLSRRHVQRDGEAEWMETLLHEMVHQWQAETGRPVDHGPEFRRKAVEVGITPRAVRRG